MSTLILEHRVSSGQIIEIRHGDITQEPTDAIINAANEYLYHGGGVAAAILRHGGEIIQTESDQWVEANGEVPTGQVAVTTAGQLQARYIIHAVGPIWRGGQHNEANLLASAVQQSLQKADKLKLTSIAMPAISSGIFGFPKEQCATIIVTTIQSFFTTHPASSLCLVRLTNIDTPTVEAMRDALVAMVSGKHDG